MKLFEPISIRGMTLRNRTMMAPMQTNVGYRSRRGIAYYVERGKGGIGAIACAAVPVDIMVSDKVWGKEGALAEFVKGMRRLTDEVHKTGAKIGLQLMHNNYYPAGMAIDDQTGNPIAPSAVVEPDPPRHPWTNPGQKLNEATVADIKGIIEKFAKASKSVKDAGYDFVIFHGAHGYLPCQFFSALDNHRTDQYGGDLKRRMRFGIESIEAMRATVGDYPIMFRLGVEEETPGGITRADAAEFAVELEKAGVDCIDVSVADYLGRSLPPSMYPMATFADLAEAVKKKVKIPVCAVGRFNDPQIAEAALQQGKADIITIGRQTIADPHFVAKVQAGKFDEVISCLSCNTCEDTAVYRTGFMCSVNPEAGKELEFQFQPAEKSKKVVVVGGGPAGMEAALYAAKRGHKVTLCEKEGKLGGQLIQAAVPPHKEPIGAFCKSLITRVRKAGVDVKLGKEVTAADVIGLKPDAVVVASGATPIVPDFTGVQGQNVVSAIEVLNGKATGNTVVVVGGGMVGCETALYLVSKSKQVTVVEMLGDICADVGKSIRPFVIKEMKKTGVKVEVQTRVEEISAQGVKTTRDGKPSTFAAESVVIAVGMKGQSPLAKQLEGKVPVVVAVGDGVEMKKIVGAVADGAKAGRDI